ncbi:hypothetical protein RKE29_20985 [Streptomyces sp. B1866]|uniref:hypothetical protein n=1 Tax=Streptomyces sp. B1866 TaxID=3075431 RepID=UPI00288E3F36|nr:hypothetical protein [Streptomyces sp. B1866]MDT3399090.1 hypothetical protein [Streptomyces sp. B1866]
MTAPATPFDNARRRPGQGPGARPAGGDSPETLLAGADRILGTASTSVTGVWPRAAALLLRHALEEALRGYWRHTRPDLARCRTHAQALCLAAYAGPEVARRWSAAWQGLSGACHYHGYELSPAPGELRAWRDEVAAVVAALPAARGPGQAPHTEPRPRTGPPGAPGPGPRTG